MKKILCVILALTMLALLCSCTRGENSKAPGVTTPVDAAASAADSSDTSAASEPKEIRRSEPSANVDIDLTKMNSTMVYSQVSDMVAKPGDYKGKSVRMQGNFAVFNDESTGKLYYACIIADATACCSQGIEFVLDGDYKYPEDYPNLDDWITVEGNFSSYQEGEYTYCTLLNAKFI